MPLSNGDGAIETQGDGGVEIETDKKQTIVVGNGQLDGETERDR